MASSNFANSALLKDQFCSGTDPLSAVSHPIHPIHTQHASVRARVTQYRELTGGLSGAPRRGVVNSLSLSVYQKRLARLCDGWKPEPIRPCVRAVPEGYIPGHHKICGTYIYCIALHSAE